MSGINCIFMNKTLLKTIMLRAKLRNILKNRSEENQKNLVLQLLEKAMEYLCETCKKE